MKVVFLGVNTCKEKVSGFVTAFGLLLSMRRKESIILLQSAYTGEMAFEDILGSSRIEDSVREEIGPYMCSGLRYLSRKYEEGNLSAASVRNASEQLFSKHLRFLSAGNILGIKDELLRDTFRKVTEFAEELAPLVFIDGGVSDETADELMIDADLVVYLVESKEFDPSFIKKTNAVYLLCDYHEEGFFNTGNLERFYHLPSCRMLPILPHPDFLRAMEEGRLRSFFEKRRYLRINEEDVQFFRSMDNAAQQLLLGQGGLA